LSSHLLSKNNKITIYKINFAYGSVWMCSLISDVKGGTLTEGVEYRVLRKIFQPKRVEVTGGWRKLHNEEFHNLYFSPSVIRMIKSRRLRWAGHVA
jgi:hypothetical protein